MQIRHVILDRDGVLNQEAQAGSYVLRPAEFRWLPGALDALVLLHRQGIRLSVASNQSPVGRGLITREGLDAIDAAMLADVRAAGAGLEATFYCVHAPDADCECRKPRPGLINMAVAAADIDVGHTVFVGDDVRDIEAAQAGGVGPVLVRSGKGRATEAALARRGVKVPIYDDLLQFAATITRAS
jgi:D-glycero-D-manno-heptose 1,7-bisphosphate phosphatase